MLLHCSTELQNLADLSLQFDNSDKILKPFSKNEIFCRYWLYLVTSTTIYSNLCNTNSNSLNYWISDRLLLLRLVKYILHYCTVSFFLSSVTSNWNVSYFQSILFHVYGILLHTFLLYNWAISYSHVKMVFEVYFSLNYHTHYMEFSH